MQPWWRRIPAGRSTAAALDCKAATVADTHLSPEQSPAAPARSHPQPQRRGAHSGSAAQRVGSACPSVTAEQARQRSAPVRTAGGQLGAGRLEDAHQAAATARGSLPNARPQASQSGPQPRAQGLRDAALGQQVNRSSRIGRPSGRDAGSVTGGRARGARDRLASERSPETKAVRDATGAAGGAGTSNVRASTVAPSRIRRLAAAAAGRAIPEPADAPMSCAGTVRLHEADHCSVRAVNVTGPVPWMLKS